MAGLATLSRDDILGADDLAVEEVNIPEWGGVVRIRTLTAKERDSFEESMVVTRGRGRNATREVKVANLRASLAVRCIVDETGTRMFNDNDADALGLKAGRALDRIWDVASRLAGIGAEDVDELLGNSEADPSELSTSS